jgi:hypothetical protein
MLGINNIGQPVFSTVAGYGNNRIGNSGGGVPFLNRVANYIGPAGLPSMIQPSTSFNYPNANINGQVPANPLAPVTTLGTRTVNTLPGLGIAYNANLITAPANGLAPFQYPLLTNFADNPVANGYNLARSGLNYGTTRYNTYNPADPRFIYNRAVFPNGYPLYNNTARPYYRGLCADYPNGYPFDYPNDNGNPFSGYPYGRYPYGAFPHTGFSRYDYPLAAPECAPHINCGSYSHPNDCRSCVSAQGGPSHCAGQICGAHFR